jgi:hypothetical protein
LEGETAARMQGNDAILKSGRLMGEDQKECSVNLYKPFAKRDEKKKAAVGLIRKQLPKILETLIQANSEKLTVIAESEDKVAKLLEGRVAQVRAKIESLALPTNLIFPTTVPVADPAAPAVEGALPTETSESDDEVQTLDVSQGLVKVGSWCNVNPNSQEMLTQQFVGTVCVTVAIPRLFDPYATVADYMKRITEKFKTEDINVVLCHSVDTNAFINVPETCKGIQDLIDTKRAGYSWDELVANKDEFFWIPKDPQVLAQFMANPNSVFYITPVRTEKEKAE